MRRQGAGCGWRPGTMPGALTSNPSTQLPEGCPHGAISACSFVVTACQSSLGPAVHGMSARVCTVQPARPNPNAHAITLVGALANAQLVGSELVCSAMPRVSHLQADTCDQIE